MCHSNRKWKDMVITKFESCSQVVQTKKGPIEFSKKGNAPYCVCFHGTPGMHDGFNNYFQYIVDAGIGVIAPSR